MIAKQTVYLNADRSKAVAEDDKSAAFLLVREGSEISDDLVEKYDASDLVNAAHKAAPKSEPDNSKEKPKHGHK